MNGLIMGTRSGDVDQSVIFYLVNTLGYWKLSIPCYKTKGMLGLTGYSDLRDIKRCGKRKCRLSIGLAMNAYRIKKYIGSYGCFKWLGCYYFLQQELEKIHFIFGS
jgi:acetate kinase